MRKYLFKKKYVFNIPNVIDGHKHEIIQLVIRPENVNVYRREKRDAISGRITTITYSGDSTILTIAVLNDLLINAKVIDEQKYNEGDIVYIDFDENFIVPLRR